MLTESWGFAIIIFVDDASSSVGELCNGSTYDSDSYCLGSNPSSPAIQASMVKRLRRCPLKAKSGVRFPLEVPDTHAEKRGFFLLSKEMRGADKQEMRLRFFRIRGLSGDSDSGTNKNFILKQGISVCADDKFSEFC